MKKIAAAFAFGLTGLLATGTFAVEADEAIKYRKQVMGTIGDQMNSIVQIVRGQAGSPEALAAHAQSMALMAGLAKAAFEQNTAGEGSQDTKAKADIWENWDDYTTKTDEFEQAVLALSAAAAEGDMAAVGQQLGAVGENCQSCHKAFRTQ